MSQFSLKDTIYKESGYDYTVIEPSFEEKHLINSTEEGDIIDLMPSNIHFNASLLFKAFNRITPVSIRVYMAFLTRLISNDVPIIFSNKEILQQISFTTKSKKVHIAVFELEREKMILRQKGLYKEVYINPLFAWTGDRTRYFDPSTLPLVDPLED